jgi:hypothetical protein
MHPLRSSSLALRLVFYVLIAVGVLVGFWHLQLTHNALSAFLVRGDEPLSKWVYVLLGPAATLFGVIVGAFWPIIGGSLLVLLPVASFAVIALADLYSANVLGQFFAMVVLPMELLGGMFIIMGWRALSLGAVRAAHHTHA